MKHRAVALPKKRIYLDYAATTPVDPRVFRAMEPYFSAAAVSIRGNSAGKFGNPGSLHSFGQEAIAAIDHSREMVAQALGARFREIIFTSSATEANNLAIRGAIEQWRIDHAARGHLPRIIVSAIEHESVLEAARALERDGIAEVIVVPVDQYGTVKLEELKSALNEHTALVSIMYANNEIGTVEPIIEISKIIGEFRTANRWPLFHADAAQAFQFLPCDARELGVDLMTISSHKIYGPKGVAALYIKSEPSNVSAPANLLRPLIFGGGQEFGLRSGTENVPAIVGFAEAVELADKIRIRESRRVAVLRNRFWAEIRKICRDAQPNGLTSEMMPSATPARDPKFLPNILNVYFPGHAAQDLLTRLDLAGVAASSGSACRSRSLESSYVIEALGDPGEDSQKSLHKRALSSIRFSLGRLTTARDIAGTLKALDSFRIF